MSRNAPAPGLEALRADQDAALDHEAETGLPPCHSAPRRGTAQ